MDYEAMLHVSDVIMDICWISIRVLLVLMIPLLMLEALKWWLQREPRRVRLAERRIRRLGDLARLDAARLERGQEAMLVEAEAKRHQKQDAREDAFLRWIWPG